MVTEEEKRLARELSKFPMKFCNACYFGDPSDEGGIVNNGTMTLIKYNDSRYGITNHHVVNAYRARLENEPELKFYVGNAEVNIVESIIDDNENLDICTVDLNDIDEESFRSEGQISTIFFEIDDFTVGDIKEGDFVLFGGYPGAWRERPQPNHIIFDTLSTGATEVNTASDMNIICELSLDKCITTLMNHRDCLPESFGGISGGPVFHHKTTEAGISVFKLVGIIYEYAPLYEAFFIRPISFITENMRVRDECI